jgi:hypothetical protein
MRAYPFLALALLACISCSAGPSPGAGATVLATDLTSARGIAVTDEHVFVNTSEGLVRVTKDGSERKTIFDRRTSYNFAVRDDTLYFNVEDDSPYYIQGAGEPIAYGGGQTFSDLKYFDVDEGQLFAFFGTIGYVSIVPLGSETLDAIAAKDAVNYVREVVTARGLVLYAGDDDKLYTFDLASKTTTEELIAVEGLGRNDADFYAIDAGSLYRRGAEQAAFQEVAPIAAYSSFAVSAAGAFVTTEDASGDRLISLVSANDGTPREVFRNTDELTPVTDGIAADQDSLFVVTRRNAEVAGSNKLIRVDLTPQ